MSSLCEMLRILLVFVKNVEAINRRFTLQLKFRSPRQVVIDLLVQQKHGGSETRPSSHCMQRGTTLGTNNELFE